MDSLTFLCFVAICYRSNLPISHRVKLNATGAIIRLSMCQWCKPERTICPRPIRSDDKTKTSKVLIHMIVMSTNSCGLKIWSMHSSLILQAKYVNHIICNKMDNETPKNSLQLAFLIIQIPQSCMSVHKCLNLYMLGVFEEIKFGVYNSLHSYTLLVGDLL